VSDAKRQILDAPNWQMREPVYCLRSGRGNAAYYKSSVPRTWSVNTCGQVDVAAADTAFPALDAWLRWRWAHDGTFDVVNNGIDDFKPVIFYQDPAGTTSRILNPLDIVPYASTGGRLERLRLSSDGGFDPSKESKRRIDPWSIWCI
jgi:hypothetical protein